MATPSEHLAYIELEQYSYNGIPNEKFITILKKTLDYIFSTPWGKAYEPFFDIVQVTPGNQVYAVVPNNAGEFMPEWSGGRARDITNWLARKIRAAVIQERNKQSYPYTIEWDRGCETPVSSFNNIPVRDIYSVYNCLINSYPSARELDFSSPSNYHVTSLKNMSLEEPAPQQAEPAEEVQPTAEINIDEPLPANEVHIIFDEGTRKFRALGNDGTHGNLWVRFPTDLREEGAIYTVGRLDYAEGSNGTGFYKVGGFIRRANATDECLNEALHDLTHVVKDSYRHFVNGLGKTPTVDDIFTDINHNYKGYEDIDINPEESLKWYLRIKQELDSLKLEYVLEESRTYTLAEAAKAGITNYDVEFEFTYPGEEESETYFYSLPENIVIEAVRRWFSNHEVDIDGTDNHVWNLCGDLAEVFGKEGRSLNDLMYQAVEDEQEWIKEQCKDDAFEQFIDEWTELHELDEEAIVYNKRDAWYDSTVGGVGGWSPAEAEEIILSDISGEEIDDWDNIWKTPDGDICSEEEAEDLFRDEYVEEVDPSSDEYQTAKEYIKTTFQVGEDFFKNPKTHVVKLVLGKDAEPIYDDTETWELHDYLDQVGYSHVNPEDLDWEDGDHPEPDYYDESLIEDMKEKMFYQYEGPIYQFGKIYKKEALLQTMAVSKAQAINNLLYQAAKLCGFDRTAGANIDIDRNQVFSDEDFARM